MTVRRFAAERSSVPLDAVSPVYRRESERILEGLRRAGMPEEIDRVPAGTPEIETVRSTENGGIGRCSAVSFSQQFCGVG
jgi:hypothetical protein